jgi:hypothetical protein
MKFKSYINEAKKPMHKINGLIKKKINNKIYKILKPTYFKKIPLQPIFDLLSEFNLVPLQEDNTYWDGMLMGGVNKTEQVQFPLGVKDLEDDKKRYPVVTNAELQLSYYKMPSGKYETIAYIG